MLPQKHGVRVILAGDFNSTETLDRSSTGGLLEATKHRAGALLGSVASDPTYYSGCTGSSPVGGDGFQKDFL